MTTEAPAATSWAQRAAAAAGNASSSAADTSATTAAADGQTFDSRSHVVLDTNALLVSGNGGAGLSRYAKSGKDGEVPAVLVTTKAALAEVRDAASRAALERTRGTGVCELSLREPQEEDVKAGQREGGISPKRECDNGEARARERNSEPKKKSVLTSPVQNLEKPSPPQKKKPSKVLAFARETGELHSISSTDARLIALARGLERAAGREARLRLGPPPPRAVRRGGPRARPPPGWGASGGDWAPLDALEEAEERLARASGVGEKKGEEEEGEGEEEAAAAAAPPTPEQSKVAGEGASGDAGGDDESGDDESGDESGDDGWTTAAKSTAAQRRSKRTAARKAAREEVAAAAAAAATAPAAEGEEEGWETASDDDSDDSGSGSDDGERAAPSAAAAGTHDELDDDPAADSPISLVTSDFAMQNVALQMGLRVVASDAGSRIREARRWALRCSACSFCSREAGRLFCPRCGNASLDKVEVVVGASGAAAFGVRRSHCLRGTKFSLPKPRGGRGGSGPILREDQLLEAMARARRSNRGRKGARAAAAAAAAGDDPLLAPELATADAWFKAAGGENGGLSATAALGGATAALVAAAWKHNPNEARRWGGGVRASGSAGKRK